MTKNNLLTKAVYSTAFIFAVYLLILNITSFKDYITGTFAGSHRFLFIFFCLFMSELIFFVLIYHLLDHHRQKVEKFRNLPVAACIFFLSLAARLFFICIMKTPQFSDYELLYNTTAEIAGGERHYLTLSYFSLWAYQTGFPAIMALIYRFFGGIMPLIAANCVFMSVVNVLLYLIVDLRYSKKTAVFVSVLFFFFPYPYSLAPVYTNQHLASALVYLSIYLLLSSDSPRFARCAVAGAVLALSNAVRPESIVIIAAVAVITVLTLELGRNDRLNTFLQSLKAKLPIFVFIAVYFLTFALISGVFRLSGLSPSGLENNFPLYKFAVGLNHESVGSYNTADAKYLINNKTINDTQARDRLAIGLIRERINKSPSEMHTLFRGKLERMWTAIDRAYAAFYGKKSDDTVYMPGISLDFKRFFLAFSLYDGLYLIALFIFVPLAFLRNLFLKKTHTSTLLFTLLFLATVVVFLLIEVQRRYSYLLLPALFIIAADSLGLLPKGHKAQSE